MAVKMLTQRKARKQARALSYGQKLRALIEEQRVLANRLAKLIEDMEDEEDHRAIELAKKRDAGKPGIPWAEAKKRLGLD
jgi:DNA anti-recombination protein RmuC